MAIKQMTTRPFRHPIPKADVVLHCGDITENGIPEDYERAVRMLGSIEAELRLVIPSNHDLSLD
jgi:3',5'-cyclic AMP phosphodiesterase CpdA